MWIKSLNTDVWVNMSHITHFSIVKIGSPVEYEIHQVTVFLDTSEGQFIPSKLDPTQVQASVLVYEGEGTHEECEQFIREQIGLQTAWQWIGYLVGGGVGAVLTLLFS